ncbi:flavin reductase family protein [Candidatus Bariatricus faecipullorum]
MAKQLWKGGNMLYPVPAVMVSLADREGKSNIITVAWAGTVCTNPPMLSISVRPERYSYGILKDTGEFVVNLTTEHLARATDFCGVKSGRDMDKFRELGLTEEPAEFVRAPLIGESPVNLECRVTKVEELGSHHLFLAEVLAVHADEAYLDENNRFALEKTRPLAYVHGQYYGLGNLLGTFGYSVRKRKKTRKKS